MIRLDTFGKTTAATAATDATSRHVVDGTLERFEDEPKPCSMPCPPTSPPTTAP